MSKLDVCVVGEINLDLILYGLPKELVLDRELLANGLALTLGSSSAIFAHNLSILGDKVGFVSKIGEDPLGKMAMERLASAGVELTRVKQASGQTSTGLTVVLPHSQQRYILTYPGTMFELQYSDIDMAYVKSARHLHVSSFFLHRALRPRIIDLFRQAKAAGLSTSLDTNDDPENRWERDLLEVLKLVDVFLPNDREAKKIARTDDLSQAINILAGLAKIVVVKRGAAAAICRSGQEQCSLMPPTVKAVDDVGAGDSFDAGFIHQFLTGAKLEDCLAYANVAGAYSTTKEGGTEAFRDKATLNGFIRQHWANKRK
ncbi:MAG TPA: carbohydrate kinase family protein [Terriglobales bacterium]|nr:carbohydrate kinase family protein [Terriglobales bacterium]